MEHTGMEVSDSDLGGIPEALRQCERKCLDVSLELELRASLDVRHVRALKLAIQRNKQITIVKFHLRGGWDEISSTNRAIVAELVTAVAPLPNLRELVVIGNFVPISAIITLLAQASQLQCLRLQGIRNLKACDTQVLVDFCRALQRHMALRSLTFKPQVESRCEPKESSLLQLLLEALAESPVLQEVEIETNVKYLSGPPLVQVCNSSTLLKLELRPQDGVGVDGLQALARNTSIQILLVCCQLSEPGSSAVGLLLRTNSALRKLTVLFPEHANNDDNLQSLMQPIADALRANTTLSDLRMPFGGKTNPCLSILQIFAGVLGENYALQTLEIFQDMSRVQHANYDDIGKMRDKITKEALLLGKRIMYYTMLNSSGRGRLLSTGTNRSQWVDKLVEFSYSLDHLYFFLRTNPTLCSEIESEQRVSANQCFTRKRSRG